MTTTGRVDMADNTDTTRLGTNVVYVVSSGEYSDYRVLCACPTKADAEAVAAKLRADTDGWRTNVAVESLDVVTGDVEPVYILRLTENLYDDGTTDQRQERIGREWTFDSLFGDAVPVSWRWVRAPVHGGRGGRLEVSGTDHERVRRVFSDRRGMILSGDPLHARKEARGRR